MERYERMQRVRAETDELMKRLIQSAHSRDEAEEAMVVALVTVASFFALPSVALGVLKQVSEQRSS